MSEAKTYRKNLETPDERRDFKAHGHLDLVNFAEDLSIGRAVFEPGWRWSTDVRPLAGTEICEASHSGYCISGQMTIRLVNGDEFTIRPGDAFFIPPGHDAWVIGNEPCVLIDVGGYSSYAKKAA
jgi:mannose-6-phosphate isomerase-like protein (cupin superfamily)